jgi:hypothetical protein
MVTARAADGHFATFYVDAPSFSAFHEAEDISKKRSRYHGGNLEILFCQNLGCMPEHGRYA